MAYKRKTKKDESAEEAAREDVRAFTANDDWRSKMPPPYKFTGARDGAIGFEGDGGGGGEG